MMTRRRVLGVAGAALLAAPRIAAGAPVRGGHLRAAGAAGSTTETLDPARQSMGTDYIRGHMFYDGLMTLDEALTPVPALAEAVESDDLVTWHIRLRAGVVFHDGGTLVADDVVYSLARHRDPATGSQQLSLARQMQSIRAVGPREVEIVLATPNVDFPAILAISHFAIIRDGTTHFETANGTGPFRCTAFVPGVRAIGTRHDAFWGEGPYLDTIELVSIADEMARHNALLSGDVDIITSVNPRLVRLLRDSGFAIVESPSAGYTDLAVQLDHRFGASPDAAHDIARALQLLVDRDLIRRSVFLDYARVGNDHPIPPESNWYNHDLAQRPFDPDQARFLLRRAGVAGERLPMVCSPAALGSVEIAVLMQDAAKRIGQDLDVRRMPTDGYWSQYWLKTPIGFGNINPRPAPGLVFDLGFSSASPWNESRWRDPRFDALLTQARAEADTARRRDLYGRMQALIHENSGICIPCFTTGLDGCAPYVRGVRPSQAGELIGYDFARHVWRDDRAAVR